MSDDLDLDILFADDHPEKIKREIDETLDKISTHQWSLGKAYVRLGCLVLDVKVNQYWRQWGFKSFGEYIDSVKDALDRGRAFIYMTMGIAEKLLPHVSEADLTSMGISRAQELARFVKQSGRRVPAHLLDLALDNSKNLSELHVSVLEALHERCDPKGNWLSLEGFYALPDEKKEIEQAYERAKAMLQLPSDTPEHQVRKEVMLAWVRDFMATNPIPFDDSYISH